MAEQDPGRPGGVRPGALALPLPRPLAPILGQRGRPGSRPGPGQTRSRGIPRKPMPWSTTTLPGGGKPGKYAGLELRKWESANGLANACRVRPLQISGPAEAD